MNYWPGTIILWTFIKYLIVHIWTWLIVSDILNLSDFVLTCEVAILYLHNLMSPSGEKDGFVNEIFYSKNSESNLLFIAWFVIAHTLAYEVKKNHLKIDVAPWYKSGWMHRIAKCHGYDGYICVKILAVWGKSFGKQPILQNQAFFLGRFVQRI